MVLPMDQKMAIVSRKVRKTDCKMIHTKEKDCSSKGSIETSNLMNELSGSATTAPECRRTTTKVDTKAIMLEVTNKTMTAADT